jgi:predicted DNA-binding transcriptional regulator AlpA
MGTAFESADNPANPAGVSSPGAPRTNEPRALVAPGRRLGDVRAVGEKLFCSTRHVYRLADGGKMPPPLRLGALVRWDLDEIDRWIAAGCPSCRKGAGR